MKLSQVCAGVLVSVALVTAGAGQVFAQDYGAKVKTAMTMLKDKLNGFGAPKLDNGTIYFGSTKINGDYDVVDAVADANVCTATVFMSKDGGYQRVSTNVIKEGKRAVGTVLDPNGKVFPMIQKGQAYYGPADILGSKYETGYEPIKNEAGEVIGIYYVGFKI